MKASRRNLANAAAKAARRQAGPPKLSKYAAKRTVEPVAARLSAIGLRADKEAPR